MTATSATTTTTAIATAATTATTTAAATADGNGIKRIRSSTQVPPWVLVMINVQYNGCMIHTNDKDNKLDRFCIDCGGSFCNKCSSNHHGHKSIKIRRYVYHDVINRPDAQKHFDCSGIQGYVTNRAKVLFLKQRHDDQQVKEQQQNTRNNNCIVCKRSLPDSRYCSIQCKVSAMYNTENTEEAAVDNNVSRKKGEEESENGLYDAMEVEVPTTLMARKKKRLRKRFPVRAPMF